MLRKIRLTLAVLFFVAVTALFLDFTGTIHAWLGWTAKVQFLPALLAVNAGVVALLVLLTLLAGRVYCSVICPLGVMQDIVSWISGRRKKKKYRFFLFSGSQVAALRGIRTVRHCIDSRCRFVRGLAGSLQLLRAYRHQPVCSGVPVGKQPACLLCRACGQLCLFMKRRSG